jgi:hypothetical protein
MSQKPDKNLVIPTGAQRRDETCFCLQLHCGLRLAMPYISGTTR